MKGDWFTYLIALTALLLALGTTLIDDRRIGHLEKRVACLEHPHGESSIRATTVNGHTVIDGPHRTGCTP